jgi:hypothetical protein
MQDEPASPVGPTEQRNPFSDLNEMRSILQNATVGGKYAAQQ